MRGRSQLLSLGVGIGVGALAWRRDWHSMAREASKDLDERSMSDDELHEWYHLVRMLDRGATDTDARLLPAVGSRLLGEIERRTAQARTRLARAHVISAPTLSGTLYEHRHTCDPNG